MANEQHGGELRGGEHVLPVRVYYEDTDAGGIVYHATYLAYAERARTEVLRAVGLPPSRLAADCGIGFVVRRCVVDFLAPARLDELLAVTSTVLDVRGASFDLVQSVRRNEVDLVRLHVKLACIARNGRPARLPDNVSRALSALRAGQVWIDDGE
jgi:acyl-CoA thioester hydrolase